MTTSEVVADIAKDFTDSIAVALIWVVVVIGGGAVIVAIRKWWNNR